MDACNLFLGHLLSVCMDVTVAVFFLVRRSASEKSRSC